MVIEKAKTTDVGEILAVQKQAFQSEGKLWNDFTLPPLVETEDTIIADFHKNIILKAVVEGRIAGSVRGKLLNENEAHISRLSVHPDFQNMGIGRKLMEAIHAEFKNVKKFSLFTGKISVKNIALYEKLGYKIIEERKMSDIVTLVMMEKRGVL